METDHLQVSTAVSGYSLYSMLIVVHMVVQHVVHLLEGVCGEVLYSCIAVYMAVVCGFR